MDVWKPTRFDINPAGRPTLGVSSVGFSVLFDATVLG